MSDRHVCAAFIVLFSAAACSGGSGLEGDGGGEDTGDPAVEDSAADTELEADAPPNDIVPDDPDIQACVQQYSGCGCEPGCVDGFTEILWYPSDAGGPFPSDINPPPELLAIAVAHYTCSVCTCEESWRINEGDDWLGVDVVEMCSLIVSRDRACGGCLELWVGGCC